jgi:hypothetical protein
VLLLRRVPQLTQCCARLPGADAAQGIRADTLPPGGMLQVLQRRQGVNFRVNLKERGDVFGELALMYNCARSATVAATTESVVWVLERDVFR